MDFVRANYSYKVIESSFRNVFTRVSVLLCCIDHYLKSIKEKTSTTKAFICFWISSGQKIKAAGSDYSDVVKPARAGVDAGELLHGNSEQKTQFSPRNGLISHQVLLLLSSVLLFFFFSTPVESAVTVAVLCWSKVSAVEMT